MVPSLTTVTTPVPQDPVSLYVSRKFLLTHFHPLLHPFDFLWGLLFYLYTVLLILLTKAVYDEHQFYLWLSVGDLNCYSFSKFHGPFCRANFTKISFTLPSFILYHKHLNWETPSKQYFLWLILHWHTSHSTFLPFHKKKTIPLIIPYKRSTTFTTSSVPF